MIITDPDICQCACHRDKAFHCMPCCYPCKVCGENIKNGFMAVHLRRHETKTGSEGEKIPE